MHTIRALQLLLLSVTAAVALHAADPAFSSTLNDAQREETGLVRLTADQVKALDARIALDAAAVGTAVFTDQPKDFSKRLNDTEKNELGLGTLSEKEVGRLDGLVAVRIRAYDTPALTSWSYRKAKTDAEAVSFKRKPEIHGEMWFSLGWQSGGGTMQAAGASSTYYDPEKDYSVTVAVSAVHGDNFRMPGYWWNANGFAWDDYPYYRYGYFGYPGW